MVHLTGVCLIACFHTNRATNKKENHSVDIPEYLIHINQPLTNEKKKLKAKMRREIERDYQIEQAKAIKSIIYNTILTRNN